MTDLTDRQLDIIESRIEGVQLRDHGKVAIFELFLQRKGEKATLALYGVDRMCIDQFREQNVVESLSHWNKFGPLEGLREAAFELIAGRIEQDCLEGQKKVVDDLVNSVVDGEREVIAISAVYGAEVLASFRYMRFEKSA